MKEILIITTELPTLNEYINSERRNKFIAANMKKETQKKIKNDIQKCNISKFDKPVYMIYNWYVKNKKKDKDNIAFSKKFIQDSLVENEILPNDGWNNIIGFRDNFYIDSQNPRIEVIIETDVIDDGT